MTLREKREKGEVAAVAAVEFDRLRVKERKWERGASVRPLLENGTSRGKGGRRISSWFVVSLLWGLLSGPLLCLITPRLKSLWKHSQGTWPQLGPTYYLCSHQSSSTPPLSSVSQGQSTFTPGHVTLRLPSDVPLLRLFSTFYPSQASSPLSITLSLILLSYLRSAS